VSARLCIVALAPEFAPQAAACAEQLGLPLEAAAGATGLRLEVGPDGLQLRGSAGVLRLDFARGRLAARLQRGIGRNEPLVRALGRPGTPTSCDDVLDATAGLGRDSLLLARAGCSVRAVEQDPVVGALLSDALQRAAGTPLLRQAVERIQLVQAEAGQFLSGLAPESRPQAVYLDPMFPPRSASALVRKEMRVLAEWLGPPAPECAAGRLLLQALAAARRRVIVKRPARGPRLVAEPPPDLQLPGGATVRYDIYLTRRAPGS